MNSYRDLLAVLELTMVPSTRPQPDEHSQKLRSSHADGPEAGGTRRRHFWCSVKKQEVEVEFETRPRLGLARIVDVRRCSAFDRPTDVACGRHCLDASFRRQGRYALPFVVRPRPLGD